MADFGYHYLENAAVELRKLKTLADRAIAQVADEDLFATLDPESNSVAILMRHVGGNLRSRFRDFLTADGEKPDRDRDSEFTVPEGTTRGDLLAVWEVGWTTLLDSVDALLPADLEKTVTIRGEPHSLVQALERALAHLAYHVGQIVLLAKHLRGADWQTLSVPRGASAEFNRRMAEKASGLAPGFSTLEEAVDAANLEDDRRRAMVPSKDPA
jgi:Protein of unknown function (DUF1572)